MVRAHFVNVNGHDHQLRKVIWFTQSQFCWALSTSASCVWPHCGWLAPWIFVHQSTNPIQSQSQSPEYKPVEAANKTSLNQINFCKNPKIAMFLRLGIPQMSFFGNLRCWSLYLGWYLSLGEQRMNCWFQATYLEKPVRVRVGTYNIYNI